MKQEVRFFAGMLFLVLCLHLRAAAAGKFTLRAAGSRNLLNYSQGDVRRTGDEFQGAAAERSSASVVCLLCERV